MMKRFKDHWRHTGKCALVGCDGAKYGRFLCKWHQPWRVWNWPSMLWAERWAALGL